MRPQCKDITGLIQGLINYEIHATYSARLLLQALGNYRSSFFSEQEYSQAAREELRRVATIMPPYAPLINSVNRALLALEQQRPLEVELSDTIRQNQAAETAMQEIAGRLLMNKEIVCTHTFSQTVSACLVRQRQNGMHFSVLLSESLPNRDGIHTKTVLEKEGIPCQVGLDTDVVRLVKKTDIALLGCEAVLPAGQVVGKVGQSIVAQICAEHGIPVYVYAGRWKILSPMLAGCQALIREESFPGGYEDTPVRLFDVTEGKYITGVITEDGIFPPNITDRLIEAPLSSELLEIMSDTFSKRYITARA